MDRLKFRVWDGQRYLRKYVPMLADEGYLCENDCVEAQPGLTVEQCTGLRDTAGTLIYEGDVLKNLYPIWKGKVPPFVMQWDADRSGWSEYSPKQDFLILGNIHENPELLEANNA